MASLVDRLIKRQLINPPPYIKNAVQYEVIMGSVSYGVSNDTSDVDVYGFCIPPKHIIFPHLKGEIEGFGTKGERFEGWQKHHIKDISNNKEYDFDIMSIIKYFQLAMQNNPNIIDSLFVPRRCVLYTSQIGEYVRENRKSFLHRGAWHRFKGYAYSQMSKMKTKKPEKDSKRFLMVEKFGYDVKFAYNIVRLLNEVEQILIEHDLDLERNREQLKSIRRGEWTMNQIVDYAEKKEKDLEEVYIKSTLQYSPNEEQIKTILLNCLEMYFGSLDNAINTDLNISVVLDEMDKYIQKIRSLTK